MYIVVYRYLGRDCIMLARTRTIAKRELDELHTVGIAHTWRMHDGSGWCDGSTDAWQSIDSLPQCPGAVIYALR